MSGTEFVQNRAFPGWLRQAPAWHIKLVLLGRPALTVLCAAALFGCTLLGCTGGQSGTETPSPHDGGSLPFPEDGGPINVLQAPPCACALAGRNALLRATLLELEPCRVRARVDEVLATATALELELELESGAELDVARVTGCGDELALEPGDPVLLVYAPAPEQNGVSSTLVATWGEQHVFGTEGGDAVALPEGERDRLLEAQACSAWFDEQADEAGDAAMMEQAELAPSCDPATP